METKIVIGAIIGITSGLILRSLWAFFLSGRVEKKAAYMTPQDCKAVRDERDKACQGRIALEAYSAKTDQRLSAMDKRLDKGAEDFTKIRDDIGEIKIVLAGMKALLETKIESILIKPKEGP